MTFARIVSGQVAEVRDMPPGWTPAPHLAAKGLDWLPVVPVPQEAATGERLGAVAYQVLADHVTAMRAVLPLTWDDFRAARATTLARYDVLALRLRHMQRRAELAPVTPANASAQVALAARLATLDAWAAALCAAPETCATVADGLALLAAPPEPLPEL